MSLPETFVPGFHDVDAVRKMRYNRLGETGLQVSHLSFGGGALGGKKVYGLYDEAEAISTVQEAIKKGINYIDTGPWYGQGKSEEVLGKALKGIPRQAYYIATKVGRYETDPRYMFDFTREKTLSSTDKSLKLLGLDYVDILQVHDVEFAPSIDILLNETLPTVQSIVEAGKAHYIGVTGYSLSAIKEVVERSPVNVSMILSFSRDTLIDDTLKSYLPYFQSKGIGVVNAAGVAMGLLSNSEVQAWHPAPDNIKKVCAEAGKYCKDHGVELARMALNYTFQQPGYATNLVGMNAKNILNTNLDLLFNGISDQETKVFQEVQSKYLDTIKPCNWEDIQVEEYKEKLKALS